MMFHVVLTPDEDGWIVAECPALPGCISQGKTEQEALDSRTAGKVGEMEDHAGNIRHARASNSTVNRSRFWELS